MFVINYMDLGNGDEYENTVPYSYHPVIQLL